VRILRGSTAQAIEIALEDEISSGGEARIYAVESDSALVAKIYRQPKEEAGRKLAVMLDNPPTDPTAAQGHASIAWPVDILYSLEDKKRVVGYLMPRAEGTHPVIDFYNPLSRRETCPLFSYQYLYRTARNLAAVMHALHKCDYVIGDVNESNILVTDTALITVVDTDSFQVHDTARETVFHCPVGKPEFTPAELQGKLFHYVDRTPAHDRFGLAVLIFQLLMEGTHPFAGVYLGEDDPPPYEARITAGHFPYGIRETPYRPLPAAPPLSLLPAHILQLFMRCFQEGHDDPQARPDAQTWALALKEAEQNLISCAVNEQHRYGKHLAECPWCQRASLLGGRDPFPSVERVQQGKHLQPLPQPVQTPLPAASVPLATLASAPLLAPSPAPLRSVPPPLLAESTVSAPSRTVPDTPPAPRITVAPRTAAPASQAKSNRWILPVLLLLGVGAVAVPLALHRPPGPTVTPAPASSTVPPEMSGTADAPPIEVAFATGQKSVTGGDSSRLRYLLTRDPQLAKRQGKDNWTLLHFAAYSGQAATARLLLESGADVDAKEKDGFTPLHLAAQEGKTEVVKVLLEKGANPNTQENIGWTPLHFAAQEGHLDVAKLLLDGGADPNIKESRGITALAVAVKEKKTAVADLIRQKGGQP